MANSKYHSYPYTCAHLWYLWQIKKFTGKQILDLTVEMQHWLDECCVVKGERTFIWDNYYTRVYLDYNKDAGPILKTAQQISLSDCIYFRYEQDLLAFRLRWGIQDTIAIP